MARWRSKRVVSDFRGCVLLLLAAGGCAVHRSEPLAEGWSTTAAKPLSDAEAATRPPVEPEVRIAQADVPAAGLANPSPSVVLASHADQLPSHEIVVVADPLVAEAAVPISAAREATLQAASPRLTASPVSMASELHDGLSLEELTSIALNHNPSIQELTATTQKAAGYRSQVSLWANPTLGYQGQQLADRGTDQHLLFAEQEFVTADKLALNRRVSNEALRAQLFELEAQRQRVVTDIRIKFYEALAAQRQIELIDTFRSVTDKGYELAELRRQASEGSKIDVYQAKIQKSEIDLALKQARVRWEGLRRELAAMAGIAELPRLRLQGELPRQAQGMEWNSLAASLVSMSPEYIAAQTRIAQAQANLQRHEVQAIPNLSLQVGAGKDNGTDSGMMNVQVGAPIPLFNKNQGNIAAARAEVCRAYLEAQRIEKSIQARLAHVSREYDAALAAVQQYDAEILPSAQASLELAEEAYRAGETDFLQVLVARRTYFDSNLQYLFAQAELGAAQAKLDGYLLSGGLDEVRDGSGDASLRDLTFSQQ